MIRHEHIYKNIYLEKTYKKILNTSVRPTDVTEKKLFFRRRIAYKIINEDKNIIR